jgi:hypothetical protein
LEDEGVKTDDELPSRTDRVVSRVLLVLILIVFALALSLITDMFLGYVGIHNCGLAFAITLISLIAYLIWHRKREEEGPKEPSPTRKRLNDLLVYAGLILILVWGLLALMVNIDLIPSMMIFLLAIVLFVLGMPKR